MKKKKQTIHEILNKMQAYTDKMGEAQSNANLSDTEKTDLIKKYNDSIVNMQKFAGALIQDFMQKEAKKQKVSKHALVEAFRKYKKLLYGVLKCKNNEAIEDITNEMYENIDELYKDEIEDRKLKLTFYYMKCFKDIDSFKNHLFKIVEVVKPEELYEEVIKFYKGYLGMVIQAVAKRYEEDVNKKVEELKAAEEEKLKNIINPDVPTLDTINSDTTTLDTINSNTATLDTANSNTATLDTINSDTTTLDTINSNTATLDTAKINEVKSSIKEN